MRTRTTTSIAALVLTGALVGAGCSSGGTSAEAGPTSVDAATRATVPPGAPSAALAKEQGRTVIDVRTPSEFAGGHVDGATNLDIQGPDFATQIAALEPDTDYVVYCRSGNRSAVAAEQMRAAGLDVLDGGALTTMVDAGWPAA